MAGKALEPCLSMSLNSSATAGWAGSESPELWEQHGFQVPFHQPRARFQDRHGRAPRQQQLRCLNAVRRGARGGWVGIPKREVRKRSCTTAGSWRRPRPAQLPPGSGLGLCSLSRLDKLRLVLAGRTVARSPAFPTRGAEPSQRPQPPKQPSGTPGAVLFTVIVEHAFFLPSAHPYHHRGGMSITGKLLSNRAEGWNSSAVPRVELEP